MSKSVAGETGQAVNSRATARTVCPNCWQPVAEGGARFCPTCGVNLNEWARATIPAASARRLDPANNIIPLVNSVIHIGRDSSSDIRLDHPAVSERHARLEWRPANSYWYLVDENSAKGTFINYRQVPRGPKGQLINPESDTVWIAPYAFRLSHNDQHAPASFEPAHLRLDAVDLVREVKHESTGQPIHILNLQPTPLSFRPGEFIALVGGSGAGKSTLMKALLGLAPAQNGTVYVGGWPFISDGQTQRFQAMHTVIGYVPQDDIVHFDLTPLEALEYIARFRLSPDLNRQERLAYIQETLSTVELWPHRDKVIRKLSGGQRKRVNIALELMAHPRLLFLDEPTSGLDPGLDLSVMELLRDWAADPADPRTIILVTHATENVTQCKYVAFLAPGGYVVYFGPPDKALAYFGVDRFAEIYRQVGQYQLPELVTADVQQSGEPAPKDVGELVTRFKESVDHFHYVASRQLGAEQATVMTVETAPVKKRHILGDPAARERFSRQWRTLTARYWNSSAATG